MKILMPDLMKVEHNVRVIQEARTLKEAGYSVKIVGFSNKTKDRSFQVNGIDVISFYLHDERKGIGKIIRYITALKMIFGIYLQVLFTEADVYHTHNFHVLPVCFFSALLHRGKLIYDTHETWTIHRKQKFHSEHILAFIIEKMFLRFIDGFITINTMVADFYQKKYHIKETTVLYNVRPLFQLISNNIIRKELCLNKNQKVALFVGGFWPTGRGIIELIQSAKYLNENVVIVLMGYGSDTMLKSMREEIKRLSNKNKVFILPPQPPEKVMDYVMGADIGMNIIKRENRAQDFQSPWKLFEYCMGGLTVISTDLPFHRKIYQKYNIGLLCDKNNSPKIIAEKINEVIISTNFKTYKRNARYAAENEFNWEVQEQKLLNLYKRIITGDLN